MLWRSGRLSKPGDEGACPDGAIQSIGHVCFVPNVDRMGGKSIRPQVGETNVLCHPGKRVD